MNKITRFISSASVIQLLGILFLIQFFKTGIWVIPNIEGRFVISRDLIRNPFSDPNAHYLMWSFLGACCKTPYHPQKSNKKLKNIYHLAGIDQQYVE